MIIRNDASHLIFFPWLAARPLPELQAGMTEDRSGLKARVYHLLSRFYLFTGNKADIHIVISFNPIFFLLLPFAPKKIRIGFDAKRGLSVK
ncbi:hypothetical protein [Algoriphagus yeomjeoni]|uniref:Uncharacterized protein n=1 Tax=Algoriphagus yeomjeoni TaxID=291403 RepID=A0A327PH13_9BACT|nr:hypothetical protein [Algoriphagus yeomjeoni]RAI91498.1 hypothetical protein LV83_01685 [Algoriphagus yeomjeoni]